MKKLLLFIFLFFLTNIFVFAGEFNRDEFESFALNPNLFFHTKTYKDDFPTWHGCFLYMNKENELLNGKKFVAEYACVEWNPNLNDGSFPIVKESIFYFPVKKSLEKVRLKPHFFATERVLYDIEAFFVNYR